MIEIKRLTHKLGENTILDGIDLTLKEGSIMGLVGINGAGKSTLLRLMAGVYVPTQGDIWIDGVPAQNEAARRHLFFLPDDPYFTIYTTGRRLFDMYRVFFPTMAYETFAAHMQTFGLDEKKPIRNFSKGMRRQLYVALALAAKPKYLLLDEAFDGLDPLARLTFKRAVIDLVEENGTGVMISSHSLRELEDFCDCYALIDQKNIASSGDITARVSRYCKFQLAFLQPVEDAIFADLPVVSLERSGRFVRVVLEGESEAMRAALERLAPTVMEPMPMDFEEMFIHEVDQRGYLS